MPNIFTKRVLDRFTRLVPELQSAIAEAKMKLNPSLEPPFDMLVRSIVYQQLSYKAAKTIYDRLLVLVGKLTPRRILSKSDDELRSVGLSRQKASYVQNVGRAFGRGGSHAKYNTVEAMRGLSTPEIVELFVEIKGVGPWTAEMYLIFSLGRLDVLSAGDLGVRKGVMKLYGLSEMPTPMQVKTIAEKWHPLETVGTFLAWRALESE
jgi:DNA-3-methyladenine glycosylase II